MIEVPLIRVTDSHVQEAREWMDKYALQVGDPWPSIDSLARIFAELDYYKRRFNLTPQEISHVNEFEREGGPIGTWPPKYPIPPRKEIPLGKRLADWIRKDKGSAE